VSYHVAQTLYLRLIRLASFFQSTVQSEFSSPLLCFEPSMTRLKRLVQLLNFCILLYLIECIERLFRYRRDLRLQVRVLSVSVPSRCGQMANLEVSLDKLTILFV
jgi:hypothetical protein